MKYNLTIVLLVLLQLLVNAQGLPNDCVNYIQVCGNYDINLNVAGAGAQEIGDNACNSQEHNSLWLQVTIKESGTLGFTLTPESLSIQEDYDFWVFGPNAQCGNLGEAIRCSTTNPQAAGQANNHTGLNESSTDVSEGPGPDGDSFLKWLDVVAGENYFIVIDRPHGNSAFQLTWTGTAILDNPLLDYNISNIEDIYICDVDNDSIELYDFSIWNTSVVDSQHQIEVTYHRSESDAAIGINPLSYPDEVQEGIYYARVIHLNSKCYDLVPIRVIMSNFQLDRLEVLNENQIIAHHNIPSDEGLYFKLDDGEWQSSNVFNHVENGAHVVQMKLGECVSDEMHTYILKTFNVITPNVDGLNDMWELKGLENFEGSQVYIFDRYGKVIFESQGEKVFRWDGTYYGRKLPSGSYWYHIILPDGRFKRGHISLLNSDEH